LGWKQWGFMTPPVVFCRQISKKTSYPQQFYMPITWQQAVYGALCLKVHNNEHQLEPATKMMLTWWTCVLSAWYVPFKYM
jgi:hypothetical protein